MQEALSLRPVHHPPSPCFHVRLAAHPGACLSEIRPPEIRQITVEGERKRDTLVLRYAMKGRLAGFRFPDEQHPVPDGNRLWAHSCFEFFWRRAGASAYQEYNFSPSGQWAAYAFSGYRARLEDKTPPAPRAITWKVDDDCLTLSAEIPLFDAADNALNTYTEIGVGLSAVLETSGGDLLYYALRHPAGAPDFHHPDNFSLTLP